MAPSLVEREDFFGSLYETLKKQPEVTELNAVPDAYVPVIKLVFDKIPVRILLVGGAPPPPTAKRSEQEKKNEHG